MKRKIFNPNRKFREENKYYLLFTLDEGSEFKTISFNKQSYEDLIQNTYFEYRPGDYIKRIYPSVAILLRVVKGHDFVLRQFNGEQLATGQVVTFRSRKI